jgi:hypothetical protein
MPVGWQAYFLKHYRDRVFIETSIPGDYLMKFSKLAALLFIIAITGCGKEDENSIIPGYIKPSDFRPKGLLAKSYSFSDGTFTAGDGSCTGEQCLTVYAVWVTSNIPVEGVAVRTDDTVDSRLLYKMTRVKGAAWSLRLTYRGIEYRGSATNADITLDVCSTIIPVMDAYDPDGSPASGDEFTATEATLKKATVTFINPVTIDNGETDPLKHKEITFGAGDEIIANAYNGLATTTCP